jgi:hypothetical protein
MINPKEEHGKAIKWLGRYLKATDTKGLVDAGFAGNCDKSTASDDDSTARSRYGYIITSADVLSFGDQKSNKKLHLALPKPSSSDYPMHSVQLFQSWSCSRNSNKLDTALHPLTQGSTARSSKITVER